MSNNLIVNSTTGGNDQSINKVNHNSSYLGRKIAQLGTFIFNTANKPDFFITMLKITAAFGVALTMLAGISSIAIGILLSPTILSASCLAGVGAGVFTVAMGLLMICILSVIFKHPEYLPDPLEIN